jgi:hypothetical protein
MEQDEKDRLTAYALKMIERGDSFSDILTYLERKEAGMELKKDITARFENHRKLMDSMEEKRKPYPVSAAKIVFGITFFILTLYLQHCGIIAFPLTLPGYVIAAAALAETVKAVINIFRNLKS